MSSFGGAGTMATSLPTEVLSVLPVDPFAQLELASRITQHALATKAQQLELEGQQLRDSLVQKQNHIKMLERRVSTLELELQDMAAKSKQAVEEAHRLQSEKSLLAETVKRLHKEVARLDAFKKNLLNHLSSEDEPGLEPSVAAADVAGERLVSEVLSSISKPPPPPQMMGAGGAYGVRGLATAAATPAFPSTSGRPLYGASTPQAGQPPASAGPPYAAMAGMGMPTQPPPPSNYATPHPHAQYGAPPGSPPRVDGKEFFRQARAQLSYEQFSQFLHQIKELNAGRQTREETLRRAKDIFGMHGAGPEMYMMFEALLSRQSGTML